MFRLPGFCFRRGRQANVKDILTICSRFEVSFSIQKHTVRDLGTTELKQEAYGASGKMAPDELRADHR